MPFLFIYFRKMKKSDFGVIAVLYLVGIAFWFMTLNFPIGAMRYPFSSTGRLSGAGLDLSDSAGHALHQTREIVDDLKQKFQDFQAVQFFGVCAFCVIYLILIQKLGYYLSSVLFMLGCMLFLRVKPLFVVLSTAILMGIIYGVFTVFLKSRFLWDLFWLGPAEINQCKKL